MGIAYLQDGARSVQPILIASPDTAIRIWSVFLQKCPLESGVKKIQHVNQISVYLRLAQVQNQTGVHNLHTYFSRR